MDRLSERAGVELNAHDLRHYAISRWVDLMPMAGHSLADVQEWAGHASIRTTDRYLLQAGGLWRAHSEGMGRANLGGKPGSDQSQGPTLKLVNRLQELERETGIEPATACLGSPRSKRRRAAR
ncbi:MAG: site-specific integrase [Candidatus Riflebacteria bacterium]|nr:site-specific integrase [Candidatus Riflebacteria bacterium]